MTSRLRIAALLGLASVVGLVGFARPARAEKIGAVVRIQGNDIMPLTGLGLVIGLNGTGDKAPGAISRIQDYIVRYSVNLDAKDLATGNVALVHVTAFIRPSNATGQYVEARVSAFNGARGLKGGQLMDTPLQFGNVNANDPSPVYARASGRLTVNPDDPCNAILPVTEFSGALVIRTDESSAWDANGIVQLNLRRPSYADAIEIAQRLNNSPALNPSDREVRGFNAPPRPAPIAKAIDDGRVYVQIPRAYRSREPEFMATLLDLDVSLDTPPSIRINHGSGRIVISGGVRIVRELTVSQRGRTITLMPPEQGQPRRYQESPAPNLVEVAGPGTTPDLNDLINTLNAMGLTTEEIAGMFKDFVQLGALRAELIEE